MNQIRRKIKLCNTPIEIKVTLVSTSALVLASVISALIQGIFLLLKQEQKPVISLPATPTNSPPNTGRVPPIVGNQDPQMEAMQPVAQRTTPNSPTRPPSAAEGGRSAELDRLLLLSDGVFAIAATILILDVTPSKGEGFFGVAGTLSSLLSSRLLIYAYSFLIVGYFWNAHRQIFCYIEGFDGILISLNLLLLMFIGVTPLAASRFNDDDHDPAAIIFFALSLTFSGLMLSFLWFYVLIQPRLLKVKPYSFVIHHHNRLVLLSPILFGLSIGITFIPFPQLFPKTDFFNIFYITSTGNDFAKFFWALIPFVLFINALIYNRRRKGAELRSIEPNS